MNENVQVLILAKEFLEGGCYDDVCCAVDDAYYERFAKYIEDDNPILLEIIEGLDGHDKLSEWVLTNVPSSSDLTYDSMILCCMAWIDKLIEEFS